MPVPLLPGTLIATASDRERRERSTLEHQWSKGESVSTEDLRVALKRYRSFFERLLAV